MCCPGPRWRSSEFRCGHRLVGGHNEPLHTRADGARRVNADRRLRLWNQVVKHADGAPVEVSHVCAAAVSIVKVDSAAIAVALRATPRETIYATAPIAAELEELALTLGEGPGTDALAGGLSLVADLTDAAWLTRWPVFAPAAVRAGVRAIFALPLHVGGVRVGVMDLYRARPGDIARDQLVDALLLADTACALLLDGARPGADTSDPSSHGPGSHGPGSRPPEQAGPHPPEVHQATGMIIAQLGVTATVALIRLRAYAYANDRRLRDVAADVVARRLRFHDDGRENGP